MSGTSNVILIQAPFVQLNSPYPAPYYLKSFLERKGYSVKVFDHSIALFEKIFSRSGLRQIFSDASSRWKPAGNSTTGDFHVERFLSEKDLWLSTIDRLVAFLRGRDPEWGHFLALANGCLPGGPRTDTYFANASREQRNVSADEAKLLATRLLNDLADFISYTLDSGFGLIRYTAEIEGSLKAGFRDFSSIQESLRSYDNYILDTFYLPMLYDEWEKNDDASLDNNSPFLLGITIPFSGCLSGALACAQSAKKYFGSAVRTVAGGGFVSTELRFLNTQEFFEYFDYLSFDRGYGSLVSILEHIEAGEQHGKTLYRTIYRFEGKVIAAPEISFLESIAPNKTMEDSTILKKMSLLEDEAARNVFPDYSEVEFSRYLYPVDDANPMHRLWSDGHWLKAYLAHGCYWHSCAFCDVTLDYIRNYIPVDTAALFEHLKNQAEKTGVRGVHFCDEAAPASSLLEFSLLNRGAGLPLNFWGNIRFEKNFNPDTAAILAAGGLIGVSAGLEVATEKGLKRLGKGITPESAVRACAALKGAGILTHAYLIYGYWDEDEEELIDSAEILRQFFEHGLLDSAFWHKFVLTRHSRIYSELCQGFHPALKVTDDIPQSQKETIFALNDLSFAGEKKFDKYTEGLDRLLASWMSGETETPVQAGFPFKVKDPTVAPDLVAGFLNSYARDRDRNCNWRCDKSGAAHSGEKVLFLGSAPRLWQKGKDVFLHWSWRLDRQNIKTSDNAEAEELAALLETASLGKGMDAAEFCSSLIKISGETGAAKVWRKLRKSGIAVINTK